MARRSRRRMGRPRSRGLLVVIVVLVGGGLLLNGVRSGARSSPSYLTTVNRSFAAQLNTVFEAQRVQGTRLETLLTSMATLPRSTLAVQLDELVRQSASASATTERAARGPAPSGGTGPDAVSIVSARAVAIAQITAAVEGLLGLKAPPMPGVVVHAASTPSVLLSSTQATVMLTQAGARLAVADQGVGRLRATLAAAPGHAALVRSVFISDHSLLTATAMAGLVSALQSSSTLAVVHHLSLTTVRLTPSPLPLQGAFNLIQLPPTTSLAAQVTVSNLGNIDEPAVLVTASLTTAQGAVLATVRGTGTVAAGGALTIEMPNLAVVAGTGVILVVVVTPPPGQVAEPSLTQQFPLAIAPSTPPTTTKR